MRDGQLGGRAQVQNTRYPFGRAFLLSSDQEHFCCCYRVSSERRVRCFCPPRAAPATSLRGASGQLPSGRPLHRQSSELVRAGRVACSTEGRWVLYDPDGRFRSCPEARRENAAGHPTGSAVARAHKKLSHPGGSTSPTTSRAAHVRPATVTPRGARKRQRGEQVPVLTPESQDWPSYLKMLTAKQGKRVGTGFKGFDATFGGLAPGLLILAEQGQERALDFLKQLIDQAAARSPIPCLYLSFERSRSDIRLRTLSRLSGASSKDIANVILPFEYRPDTHRFDERSPS